MKLKFEAPKGIRVKYRFMGVQICERSPSDPIFWYVKKTKEWTINPPWDEGGICNTAYPCRSIRAFRRRLKEWSKYMPSGTVFRLISRWKGYDVYAKIK